MPQELANRETGELNPIIQAPTDTSLAVQLAQAELNQAVTTARAFPRSVAIAKRNITALATLDDVTAEENVYALVRGGKSIRGPSVRMAEIIASQWGNCHVASRVVAVDKFEKMVIAEGVFFDLETGMKRTAQITRRISDKQGRLYNDDMIVVAGNAAASIAMREAVLKGIPKAVWREAYLACEAVIAGDTKTLAERRELAFKAFAAIGVSPEQIFAKLEIGGMDDVGADELITLTALKNQIRENEATPEELFPKVKPGATSEPPRGTAGKLQDIAAGDKGKTVEGGANGKAAQAGAQGGAAPGGRTASGEPAKPAQAQASGAETASESQPAGAAEEGDAGGNEDTAQRPSDGITDDELEAAFKRGKEARAAGMAAKAVPTEWRNAEKKRLADAWKAGHASE